MKNKYGNATLVFKIGRIYLEYDPVEDVSKLSVKNWLLSMITFIDRYGSIEYKKKKI